MIELRIRRNDQEVHIRVRPRASLGDGAADDQGTEARVVAVGISEAVDGELVMFLYLHTGSITLASKLKRLRPEGAGGAGEDAFAGAVEAGLLGVLAV